MSKPNLNNGIDAFDVRLQVMQRNRAPSSEIEAAKLVYERVRTARAICQSYLMDPPGRPGEPSETSVVALAVELGREAALHSQQGMYSEDKE